MVGLGAVLLMISLCAFAPLFSPHDPETQQTWLGARGPGHSHPWLQERLSLSIHKTPQVPEAWFQGKHWLIQQQQQDHRDLRIAIHNGVIFRMFWLDGAEPIQSITLEKANTEQRFSDGKLKKISSNLHLKLHEAPPQQLELNGLDVAIFRQHHSQRKERSIAVEVQDQNVTSLRIDGIEVQHWEGHAGSIQNISIDGTPLNKFHLLGTDDLGRDLWARILYGGRISLMVGILATFVSILIGVCVGLIAGWLGGVWDRLIMNVIDILYGVPFMFLVILLLVLFGRSLFILFIALGAVQWLTTARIVRAQVLSLKNLPYIEAAKLAQTPVHLIALKHILPNIAGPIIVYATLTVPSVILEESFLAFIGLTVQFQGRSLDSWGALVHQGMLNLGMGGENAWLLIFPSLAMAITLLGLNLLGDGLRDALDPKGNQKS